MKHEAWKSLNRLRAGLARTKQNLLKLRKEDDDMCECGSVQDENQLLECPMMEIQCEWTDLFSKLNDTATKVISYWTRIGI